MASKINLKPEEVGVYAIGGLGEIQVNTIAHKVVC